MDLRDELQSTLGSAYTLERELGGGGMSRVFVADETRLRRKVVVKVLSPDLAQGISAERFQREIQLAASLQQANIVPVLSAGDAGGTPYFTMPFVEGESLRARLARGPLSIGEATSILRDVARALAYAHVRGVVHRDIKPDNVLLSGGTAVVTDFGIAKALVASATTHDRGATLTQMGTALGTPAYMAPEQAAGDPDTDYRADFYAFGCMAYELLTGRPPFEARTPQRLLAAHMGETARPVTDARPDTPPALADLVARCMAKEPSERPANADELLAALDAVSTSEPARAAMPAILLGGRGMLKKALFVYAVAFVAVALVAKAAIVVIGLPDWVFPGALVVMALGLPVILFTAYTQYVTRRAFTATPTYTPGGTPSMSVHGTMATMAMKASPHLSWRRAAMGGAYAVGAFVVLIGAFMGLRALGIGPVGSLLARGRFTQRERVLIDDFAVQNSDTALGAVVSDAVRASLSQSSVISMMSPVDVAAALKRMARPATTRVDLSVAREVAEREGIKAVIDGHITGVGTGYIVSLRLLSADSAIELAAFQETGDGPRGLIDAADKLARQLRAKIGESLRSVQASPPLTEATTPSLEALRKYSEGVRANGVEQNLAKAIALSREAVAIDSEFSSAWRLLAVALTNANGPQASIDSAVANAYRFRGRLPEVEQLHTVASYYFGGAHQDRPRAMAAYRTLTARGDSISAPINLGELLRSERAYAPAESLNAAVLERLPDNSIARDNMVELQLDQGRLAAASASMKVWRQREPDAGGIPSRLAFLTYAREGVAGLIRVADSLRNSQSPPARWTGGYQPLAAAALLRGRLGDFERYTREARAIMPASADQPLRDSIQAAALDAWFHGPSARAVARLDAALATMPLARLALADRPYLEAATAYAQAGDAAKAELIVARFRREGSDTAYQRIRSADLHTTLGEIALARGRAQQAIDEFRKGDIGYDGQPARECLPCLHVDLARAFDAAGQADSAITRYEAFIATPYYMRLAVPIDPMMLAGTHKRLGELYEAKGEREKAASHYARFLELWKDADPDLQPRVAEVRRRLARLSEPEPRR